MFGADHEVVHSLAHHVEVQQSVRARLLGVVDVAVAASDKL
jgi:hypothetical protein